MIPHEIFDALGDQTRLALVTRLGQQGSLPTVELTDGLGISRQAATKHLNKLEEAGLVRSVKVGRMIYRELEIEKINQIALWMQRRTQEWENKLDKLADLVE